MPQVVQSTVTSYLEIIVVRLYDVNDSYKVIHAFQNFSDQSKTLRCILYENKNVRGTWFILLYWPTDFKPLNISEEASFLSGLLREIGLVHHAVLAPFA